MRHQGGRPSLCDRVVGRREEVRIRSEAVEVFPGRIQNAQRPADLKLANIEAFQIGERDLPVFHPLITKHLKDGGFYSVASVQNTISGFRRIKAMDPELRPVNRIRVFSLAQPDQLFGEAN